MIEFPNFLIKMLCIVFCINNVFIHWLGKNKYIQVSNLNVLFKYSTLWQSTVSTMEMEYTIQFNTFLYTVDKPQAWQNIPHKGMKALRGSIQIQKIYKK